MTRFADPRALPGAGDRVLVAGLGRSGEAAARALRRLGAEITVTDDVDDDRTGAAAGMLGAHRVVLGEMRPSLVQGHDLVLASPGVPPHAPILAAAADAGVPVWSEVELGWRLSGVPVLGVTGTNGKTTTTEMLAAALIAAGIPAVAAGNIGLPLVDAAAEHRTGAIVCELSSFQLHSIASFHAPVGVLLNLADDHLDWHGGFDAYAAAKARLFENQTSGDVAVVLDDDRCRSAASGVRSRVVPFAIDGVPGGGAGVDAGRIVVPEGFVASVDRLRIRGAAMLADAVAAAAAACAFGAAPARAGEALESFEPAAHRMEPVLERGGVLYVNDSKATNPHAALAALSGLERAVLIAGGRNKGLDLSAMASASSVRAVVAIGESAGEIERAFAQRGVEVHRAADMDHAVDRAAALAQPGDTVILSPGCASFDQFADYKARGEAFRAAVKRLAVRTGEGESS